MKLLIYKNNELMQEISLSPGNTYKAGRKEGSDILLGNDPGISRAHFEISKDPSNQWRVNVLSDIKLVEYQGAERKDFAITEDSTFYLHPYHFKVEGLAENSPPAETTFNENTPLDDMSLTPENQSGLLPAENQSEFNEGDDEKTALKSFNGLPYVKIIGQNGKKSEYFRLEGNLWVIGSSENASVFLNEPAASPNHFEISKTEKGYFIVDLGSNNGTSLNGQKLIGKKPTRVLSGDIISVGKTSIQFELRDKSFKRKVSNIPLKMYKNPLVFFDQNVAMVSLDDEPTKTGSAEEIQSNSAHSGQNKKKFFMVTVAVLLMTAVVAKEFLVSDKSPNKVVESSDPLSKLSPAEKKIVKQTYKLAKQLYLNRNYELALAQLDKLHSIIPVYKKSREYEDYCINDREVQRQKEEIARLRREREEMEQKVNSFISQCEGQYQRSSDIDGVKACLVPASDLDPNNPRISQLITEVTARQEEADIRAKIAAENADKVRRGKELFDRAKNLHKKQKWLKAIEAYENHIHSGLPDPRRLVKKSQRSLATIEKMISDQKNSLIGQAESKYGGSHLRDAIKLARKAQRVDPYDPKISAFLFQIEKELTNKMKTIYMDSVIEERFGNLEASRVKWEDIMKQDIEDGEYYLKAKRKMKQYGFQY